MAEISAKQVMELRKKSGAGIMDAKKALVASEGDMDKAMDYLREKGIAKAAKKSDRIAAEGLTDIVVKGNTAAIVELNSETDFVAASDPFKAVLKDVANLIVDNKPADVEAALELKTANGTLNDDLIATTQKTGEKVSLRRFTIVEKNDNENFGAYLHQGGRIAALTVVEGADEATAKDVAMHVAAVNPEFLDRSEVSDERLEHERGIFKEETLNEGKPANIVDKIVEGRLNKFLSQICLAD
ncbi:MAG: translation elongation factor Ts, partial [Limosilactobacillus fermentum]